MRVGRQPASPEEDVELGSAMDRTEALDLPRRVRVLADRIRSLSRRAALSTDDGLLASDAAAVLFSYADRLDRMNAAEDVKPRPLSDLGASPELYGRIREAVRAFQALPPEERARIIASQKESFLEGIRQEAADREAGLGTI